MNLRHASLVLALTAFASAPAFAEGGKVNSAGGVGVSSGTGLVVGQGAPSSTVTVLPATSVAVPSTHLLPGGATVQHSSTTVMGGPSGDASSTKTVTTTYWVNVPANAPARSDFQRWQRLR